MTAATVVMAVKIIGASVGPASVMAASAALSQLAAPKAALTLVAVTIGPACLAKTSVLKATPKRAICNIC